MKKRFTLGTVLALMLLVAVATAVVAYTMAFNNFNDRLEEFSIQRQENSKFLKAQEIIEKNFVGGYDKDKMVDGAIGGMVGSLGDQYSRYLSADDYEVYKRENSNRYAGIGVAVVMHEEGDILITEVYDNSPAQECGIRLLDRIVAVDGQRTADMGYQVAVAAVGGEPNTKVTLTVLHPDGETEDITVARRLMEVRAVSSEILAGENIGLVRIRNFDANVDRDFIEAVTRLIDAGVDGLIFDVRYNPGGQLDVMCPMLDMLLPEGTLITLRDKSGLVTPRTSDENEVDLPMAVLVNEHSYSAAEFFAAALRDFDKAKLIGTATTGKGYAQQPIPLEDGSAVILSVAEYFTPKGESLSGVGLEPDYTVGMTETETKNFYSLTHEQDKQLQKAIEILMGQIGG